MNIVVAAGIIAFALSSFITPWVIRFARRLGLVDDVRSRSHPAQTHKGVIPRAGGAAIFLAVLVASALFIELNQIIVGVLVGAFLIVIVGLLDDYYDLSPYLRFILNILIAGLVIFAGLGIPYITNPFGGVFQLDQWVVTYELFGRPHEFLVVANLFAILWIVFIANIVNWSKGVDGQLPGFVAIASFFLGALALRFTGHDITSESVAIFAFIVGGAYLGFLPWNFYPQRIMPGYSGGALAGFLLGVLSILSWGKIGTMVLVLTVPFIDAIYVISRRIASGRSPFRGDAGHFHHRLLNIGWGRRRIAVFYWIVSFMFGLAALYMQRDQKIIVVLFAAIFIALFIIVLSRIKNHSVSS